MLTQTQAVAIILEYDTIPVALLTKEQKAALSAAKDVNKDTAFRAAAEFLGHESSKKYFAKQAEFRGARDVGDGSGVNVTNSIERHIPVTTLVEFHD